jgi:hypothetical protein
MTTSKSFNVSKYFSENSPIDNIVTGIQPVGIQVYNTVDDLPLSGISAGSQAYVNENNRLYMFTGGGWFSIALINQNPAFDSGGGPTASYELDSADAGIPLIIQLSASDPEDLPIYWSYVASDSAQYFADITNDSSVFTITTKPTSVIQQYDSGGGTFSITFKASDGVNLATALSEFTINLRSIVFIGLSGGTDHAFGGPIGYTAPNGTQVIIPSAHPPYNGSYLLSNMFNNTIAGEYPGYYLSSASYGNTSGSITINFNSSISYLSHIVVYPWTRSDSFSNITSIQEYDGANWITVYGNQGLNSTNTPEGTFYRYDFNTTNQSIRINLTYVGSWGISMNEIQVYGSLA